MPRSVSLLLNLGHALDHLFLLIFATAVGAIANEFGMLRWEDLMPYATGAFFMFGFGSFPAGRLGDLWGRRRMMLVFFFGMGASACLVAQARSALELAIALSLMGAFSAIYHPVGIPMLVRHATRPGTTIGINGLAGNLGIALAAVSTGFLVQAFGWRVAFVVPGVACMLVGVAFALLAPREAQAPARQAAASRHAPRAAVARVLLIMGITATTGGLLFNFTTNGNAQLMAQRLDGIVSDPSRLGLLLALVYAIASLAQLVVGYLIDRVAMKPLFMCIAGMQVLLFALAAQAQGWAWYALTLGCMVFVFAAIPFSDAIMVRYVDDAMRSRVSGARLAVSFSIGSLAVWLLGPVVKVAGFTLLLTGLAVLAALTFLVLIGLPDEAALDNRSTFRAEKSLANACRAKSSRSG